MIRAKLAVWYSGADRGFVFVELAGGTRLVIHLDLLKRGGFAEPPAIGTELNVKTRLLADRSGLRITSCKPIDAKLNAAGASGD